MRLKNIQRTYRLSTKARSEGAHTPSINTEGDTLSTKTIKRSALTKAVTLFALVGMGVIAHPATATFAAPDNATDGAPAAATADGGNRIIASDPGTSTATGGIKITNTNVSGRYGDKFSVNATLDIKVNYEGDKVEKGATFSVGLGDGLQIPSGFNSVALKATALDGSEKTIGQCVAANGTFTCTVTENVAEVLGGNGSIKNGFVKLEATLTKDSIGKTTTDVVVDGTKHTVSLGKGVVGEEVTPGDHKFCFSHGMTPEGLYEFMCWLQAQGNPGDTITIVEGRDDITFKKTVYTTPTEHGDWANPSATGKATVNGKTITFTIPDGTGTQENRVGVLVATSEKTMTNTATVNGKEVSSTVTWRAKGSSGAETDEDAKPVPPTPTPTPDPTPEPTPEPSEPPAPTPEPSEPPAPTPEPSTPPVTPDPEPPAPTPDPTPEAPKPDPKPEPTPEPSEPPAPTPAPTPDAPKPDPKPTPEQPTPDPKPEPSTPPVTPDPKPSVPPVTPDPEPSVPSVTPDPKPSEPPVTPEPSTPPAPTPEPKPTTPVTPNTPSTPDTPPVTPKAPTPSTPASNGSGTLAKTGADAGLIAGAGALAVVGSALLVARRRQNKN